jgi:hypothetical protein
MAYTKPTTKVMEAHYGWSTATQQSTEKRRAEVQSTEIRHVISRKGKRNTPLERSAGCFFMLEA